MPLVLSSSYQAPWWCRSAHWQTVWPSVGRRPPWGTVRRQRLELADGDFLDLDWWGASAQRVLIISHGLEGSSQRTYVRGLARSAQLRGWDVVAWNFRGCSGEPNRLPRSYHSGATEDLAAVVGEVVRQRPGVPIAVTGFSLGGNLTLKFLGEESAERRRVGAGVAISVPCDLRAAAVHMAGPECRFFMRRFLREMGTKMEAKQRRFGSAFPKADWRRMTTFAEFDEAFTAPLHGFANAEDYWERCSAVGFLSSISVPTLILNAADDPFLAPPCFPRGLAERSAHVFLEIPLAGGHVGFVGGGAYPGEYWSERRALDFLETVMPGGS